MSLKERIKEKYKEIRNVAREKYEQLKRLKLEDVKTAATVGAASGLVTLIASCVNPETGTYYSPFEDPSALRIAGTVAGMNAGDPNLTDEQRRALYGASDLANRIADDEVLIDAAERGRSEVNVNVNVTENLTRNRDGTYNPAPGYTWVNPNDPRDLRVIPRQRMPAFFTCNRVVDFNGDGEISNEEFVGIKTKFRKGEDLDLIVIPNKSYAVNGLFQLFRPKDGKSADDYNFNCKAGGFYAITIDSSLLDSGKYIATIYLNNVREGSFEIEITE